MAGAELDEVGGIRLIVVDGGGMAGDTDGLVLVVDGRVVAGGVVVVRGVVDGRLVGLEVRVVDGAVVVDGGVLVAVDGVERVGWGLVFVVVTGVLFGGTDELADELWTVLDLVLDDVVRAVEVAVLFELLVAGPALVVGMGPWFGSADVKITSA